MAVKQYKKISEVPAKYRWDLKAILGDKSIQDLIKEYEKIYLKQIEVKDSKYESKEKFLAALKQEDKLIELLFKIRNYISNSVNQNVIDVESVKLKEEFSYLNYQLDQKMGPEMPRIFAHSKQIKEWLKEDSFKNYRATYESILETEKHQLPKAIQEFRTLEQRADISASSIFSILTNSELDYGFATDSKGKKIKITRANTTMLSMHSDPKVRKSYSIEYRKAYLKHKESLANMLFQHFKKITVWAKLTNHASVIDYLVFPDRSSEKLLLSLYKAVQSNLDIFRQKRDLHKKVYKLKYGKAMTKYDAGMPLVSVKTEYTIEEMQATILKAFKPFGSEYCDVVKSAFKENWIDYMPIDNKEGGAYSIGSSYGLDKKYILMNYEGTVHSLETLAHELGHSMHSYFADKVNHIRNSQYSIFVAEIASIFNELMLFDYLLNNSNDDKLKFKIRQQMAEGFAGTVLRQVEWSNYEYDLYKAIEEGKPISSYDQISKVYYANHQKYALKKEPYKPEEQWSSVRVPHFYYGFYVYKYAIGQLVANIFFQRYKDQGQVALESYIKDFLSVGSSLKPLETLKASGIDLEDPKTYDLGFKAARDNIVELKKLAKKIYKF